MTSGKVSTPYELGKSSTQNVKPWCLSAEIADRGISQKSCWNRKTEGLRTDRRYLVEGQLMLMVLQRCDEKEMAGDVFT